jgi:ABC-type transporter Mla subunit MlaD
MSDGDSFVNDRLETVLHTLQALAKAGLFLALAALAWYGVICAQEGAKTMRELRQAATEQREFLRRQNEVIDQRAAQVVGHLAGVAQEAEEITRALRPLIPRIDGTLAEVQETAKRLPAIAGNVETVTAEMALMSADIGEAVQADQAEILATLGSIARSGNRVEVLVDGTAPELEKAIREIAATSGNVSVVTANAAKVSGDAAHVSAHWKDRIAPPPYKPTGNRFVRGLKHTGRYTWRLLRNAPELLVVGVGLL